MVKVNVDGVATLYKRSHRPSRFEERRLGECGHYCDNTDIGYQHWLGRVVALHRVIAAYRTSNIPPNHLLVSVCVCLCICLHCGKTAGRIWMRFGVVGRMGPGMRQVVGFEDRSTGWSNFGGECGAPHCKEWGVCEWICHQGWRRGLFPNYFEQSANLIIIRLLK